MADKDKDCRSQREAFEEWFGKSSPLTLTRAKMNDVSFGYERVQYEVAFEAFQAGAAWQQSRLLDEELVKIAANKFRKERKNRLGCESEGDADVRSMKAAIAEIKKHTEVV